jgi:hypothetical protein
MKYLLYTLLFLGFISCSKDDRTPQTQQQNIQQDENDNPVDTNLSPEEKFSSALLFDILGDNDEDDDLSDFLETTVYKMSQAYTGVSMAEISPAAWLVMFEKDGTVKNYLLQKFMDIKSNDYYFSLKETSLTISDIISRPKNKTSSGE